ncbi:uroporphyrinogen-III C-methyltransferase [Sporolactobacillus sp. CQH2019]|uniref:uroporphyrinogen-III C-methyltransferase n=1 Tax=Sporolactobacillus sp. CQH2019 TaxID=3023512 RepID=UPI0023685E48|nr:uroporphyrinogen-III C-methyltransferase [Sporolactobacillus sp. CQH2019]MDD9148695.1 uroporphyrinogen-III C-methyltransferase [Sporolactobacillus sp. CQH2019]
MGKVYLVGAGPGDPDLITVKGLRLIRAADTILYDRLVNETLLNEAKHSADLIYCGKWPHAHPLKQENINHLLAAHARKGRIVVRLKGGDPFIFGRGGEEAAFLAKEGIAFEIVPGITAGIAAPAYAGIPATHREYASSIALVAGHSKSEGSERINWDKLATGADTLAIYMGVAALPHIVSELVSHGRIPSTPVALIEWGTTARQRTVTSVLSGIVREAEKYRIENPCMIIVGEVVRLRKELKWFESDEKPFDIVREAF